MTKKIIFFLFFIIPFLVLARNEILPSSISDPAKLTVFLSKIFLSLGFVLSILIVVIAGFRFLSSTGNPAVQKDAKDQITSAFFGLIIFLASFLILKTAERGFINIELSNLPQQATSTETSLPSPSPLPPPEQYLREKEERERQRKLEVDYIEREGWKPVWPEKGLAKIKLFGTEVEIELFKWGEFIEKYVKYIFDLSITVGIILAIVSFIIGGLTYLKSAGNVEKQIDAKEQMLSSVFGLMILLALVVILRTFHPTFVLLKVDELDFADIEVPEGVWLCEYRIPQFEKYLQIYNRAYMKYINYIALKRLFNTPEIQDNPSLTGPVSIIFDWEKDKKRFLVGDEKDPLIGKGEFKKAIEEREINPKELLELKEILSVYCQNFQESEARLISKYFGGKIRKGMSIYLVGEYGAVFHQGLICTGKKDYSQFGIAQRVNDTGTVACIENYLNESVNMEPATSTVDEAIYKKWVNFEPFKGYCQIAYRWHRRGTSWEPTKTQEGELDLDFTPFSITVFKDNGGEFYSYRFLANEINGRWSVSDWEKLVRSVFGNGLTLHTVRNFGKEEDVPWENKSKNITYETFAGILKFKSSPWTSNVGRTIGNLTPWKTFNPNDNPQCKRGEDCWYSLTVEKKKRWVAILGRFIPGDPHSRRPITRQGGTTCEVFDEEDSNLEDNYVSVFCKHLAKNQRFPCSNYVWVFPGYVIYKAGEKPGAPFYEIQQ